MPTMLIREPKPARPWVIAVVLLLAQLCSVPLQAELCVGDCGDDGAVQIDELILGVRILLDDAEISRCDSLDRNGDDRVVVAELATAVRFSLEGCPPSVRSPLGTVPDAVSATPAGLVYLLYGSMGQIDRWSLPEQRYEPALPVGSSARQMAYSPVLDKLFVAHVADETGAHRVSTLDNDGRERVFVELEEMPHSLVAAGSHVIVFTNGVPRADQILVFDRNGRETDRGFSLDRPASLAWSDATSRLYRISSTSEPGLSYFEISQTTGQFVGGNSIRHPAGIRGPVYVSEDGASVVTRDGNIYDPTTLEFDRSFPGRFGDMIWLDEGIVTIGGLRPTTVELWQDDGLTGRATIPGAPGRVLAWDGGIAVMTYIRPMMTIYPVVFETDRDQDGIADTDDDFPDDPAASVDGDRDGAPDGWNPGYGQEDSITGLSLDAFPTLTACQSLEDALPGDPNVCDIARAIPPYRPDDVVIDHHDVVYLLAASRNRVFRWSEGGQEHLDPIPIESGALLMTYAPELDRIYLAHDDRRIRQIDLESSFCESEFSSTQGDPISLAAMGRFLLSYSTRQVAVIGDDGSIVDEALDLLGVTQHPVWSPANRRLYSFWGGSPNDIHYFEIDPSTGVQIDTLDSPRHGGFSATPPIRPSPRGDLVLLGNGELFDGDTLSLLDPLPTSPIDAAWGDDQVMVIAQAAGTTATVIEQWRVDRTPRRARWSNEHSEEVPGSPIRIFPTRTGFVAITQVESRPAFYSVSVVDDGDDDGVPTPTDRFPRDPAASIDSDGDGYPDEWNPGRGPDDSTTGLTLDLFPGEAMCALETDGKPEAPEICDRDAAIPPYRLTYAVQDDFGVIYLLAASEGRIYRWSAPLGEHLAPLDVGKSPTSMVYNSVTDQLHLGYRDGEVTAIKLGPQAAEHALLKTPDSVRDLIPIGPLLFVSSSRVLRVYDDSGVLASEVFFRTFAHETLWNETTEKIYFMRIETSLDSWDLDPTNGQLISGERSGHEIRSALETPLLGVPNSEQLLLGSGTFIDGRSLTVIDTLPVSFEDAVWFEDQLILLRGDEVRSIVTLVDENLELGEETVIEGAPLRIFAWDDTVTIVTEVEGKPHFESFTPSP